MVNVYKMVNNSPMGVWTIPIALDCPICHKTSVSISAGQNRVVVYIHEVKRFDADKHDLPSIVTKSDVTKYFSKYCFTEIK